MDEEEPQWSPGQCEHCRRRFELGEDVFRVTPGVLGMTGFVTIGDVVHVCSVECFSEEFGKIDPTRLMKYLRKDDEIEADTSRPRRIP